MFLVNCTLAPLPHIASYCHRFITLHVLLCYFACNLFEFGSLSGYCTLIAGTFCPSVDTQVLHNITPVVKSYIVNKYIVKPIPDFLGIGGERKEGLEIGKIRKS